MTKIEYMYLKEQRSWKRDKASSIPLYLVNYHLNDNSNGSLCRGWGR